MRLKSKDYLLVGIQMGLFIFYFFDPGFLKLFFPVTVRNIFFIFSVLGGLIFLLAMLQLNKNLSPFPSPKSGGKLIQTGLYKFVRHPIYSGILMALGSYAIYTLSGYRVLISLALYILFSVKVKYEEELLMQKFKGYNAYLERTGKFFPKIFKNQWWNK